MKRVPADVSAGDEVIIVVRTVITALGHGSTVYTDAGALDIEDIDSLCVVE